MAKLSRHELGQLQALLGALRDHADDYIIVSVGARGPNHDCPDGNAVATVRIGFDEATAEAVNLADALSLARGKILRERTARAAKKDQAADAGRSFRAAVAESTQRHIDRKCDAASDADLVLEDQDNG